MKFHRYQPEDIPDFAALNPGYLLLARIAGLPVSSYIARMKTLTVRLPEALVAQIDAESRRRRLSKSDVVRERSRAARTADVRLRSTALPIS